MGMHHSQRGALIIAAVFLVVVVGLLASIMTSLFAGNLRAGTERAGVTAALALAESGLERGARELTLAPAAYTGEGPVPFGNGSFTITVSDLDAGGSPLPPGQKRVISTGAVPTVDDTLARTVDAVVTLSGILFSDSFPDIANWPTSGPSGDAFNRACTGSDITTTAATQGTVSHDPVEDGGSGDGSFTARTVAGNSGERLTGYREHALSQALGAGTSVSLDFSYAKFKGKPNPAAMMMAIDAVATDGTVYRLWSDCGTTPVNWQTAATIFWTVPAGKTVDGLRLGFDIRNGTGGGNNQQPSAVHFDELTLNRQ